MSEFLWIAVRVATPLSFLGLAAALAFLAYTKRLKFEERKLELLPSDQRGKEADEYLTRYGIKLGRDTPVAEKVALIREEMLERHARHTVYAKIAGGVAVLCFAMAVLAYVIPSLHGGGVKNGDEPNGFFSDKPATTDVKTVPKPTDEGQIPPENDVLPIKKQ